MHPHLLKITSSQALPSYSPKGKIIVLEWNSTPATVAETVTDSETVTETHLETNNSYRILYRDRHRINNIHRNYYGNCYGYYHHSKHIFFGKFHINEYSNNSDT